MADCAEERQDWKRKQKQSTSDGIVKKVKGDGDDTERRLTEQRQRMANHRARETGKQKYQQVISIIGSLLSVNIFVFSFSNCRLVVSHIIHAFPKRAPHYMHMHVRTLTPISYVGL